MRNPTDPLTDAERDLVERAARKAFVLYEGRQVAHRSCGICLAETFGVPTRPYQSLRRGGITGEGECGAIKAGELILGEIFGDPAPAGAVTARLRAAMVDYQRACAVRIDRGNSPDIVCNNLTRPHGDFAGPVRMAFCTNIASEVARILAETIVRHGGALAIGPIPEK